jgi:hypothetical protein
MDSDRFRHDGDDLRLDFAGGGDEGAGFRGIEFSDLRHRVFEFALVFGDLDETPRRHKQAD